MEWRPQTPENAVLVDPQRVGPAPSSESLRARKGPKTVLLCACAAGTDFLQIVGGCSTFLMLMRQFNLRERGDYV
ncbi:jg27127 [Pararge aegeria aegeria]|uniref:Jg27127 protein n=1 Tax=Pararge aegeria aegeria TaxID=348720 RepID=A0A8S4QUT1_9NEOP|nr:jg27127 [Pararge aegeria aegeria]